MHIERHVHARTIRPDRPDELDGCGAVVEVYHRHPGSNTRLVEDRTVRGEAPAMRRCPGCGENALYILLSSES